ncbi:transcriptional regulator [Gluconobacter albidus]|uniref:Transcriptional regulator n=1 Tax=Gluconobacter albidus TaxID=318683 RepID=A0A149TLZ2_9PROT|nr:MucR family transcriptional regulator [Gluconobacter albidus]KXV49884.1 transcriptional regulator [Gluconobacter albidus]
MIEDGVTDVQKLTATIVEHYVSHNAAPAETLPALIRSVHSAFATLGQPEEPAVEAPVPAVNPKRSVFEDYIICLEDGKKLKLLKRHLKSAYDMTPDEYRAKWGLPRAYPMTAPGYSRHRTELAHRIGLGTPNGSRGKNVVAPEETTQPEIPVRQIPARRRGRPAKA